VINFEQTAATKERTFLRTRPWSSNPKRVLCLGFVFVVVAPTLPAARIAMSEFADSMRYDEETLSDELPDVALEVAAGKYWEVGTQR
jgi:hypothetical protein